MNCPFISSPAFFAEIPSKQSRESADEQILKRVKNSNVPESCLQVESEVEEQRSVPSLPSHPAEFPLHAR